MLPPTFKPVSQQIRLVQVAPGAYWILTGKNYGKVTLYLLQKKFSLGRQNSWALFQLLLLIKFIV